MGFFEIRKQIKWDFKDVASLIIKNEYSKVVHSVLIN